MSIHERFKSVQSYQVEFCRFFKELTGNAPYSYQISVAYELAMGKNLVINVPTGAGKTLSVLVPFLFMKGSGGPSRLIYALPTRTLVQGVYRTIEEILKHSHPANENEIVTIQTGEQPDDPFFTLGSIVVTTYDQVLSGALGSPYGLSNKLRNINAASTFATMVVFDEFHLMPPDKAFLTAIAISQIFKEFQQSVWMTATATCALTAVLKDALDVKIVSLTEKESAELPSISQVNRELVTEQQPISASHVLKFLEGRSIVILNTVERSQKMFKEIQLGLAEKNLGIPVILLHSRFFKNDRQKKELWLSRQLGKNSRKPVILVATQVIEAGIDISCDHLHTEICPVNSLVQRAGRCARYAGESGLVHVYRLPAEDCPWLPYGNFKTEDPALARTILLFSHITSCRLTPELINKWVEGVHKEDDARLVREGWRSRRKECFERIRKLLFNHENIRIADLIRGDQNEQVRVIIEKQESLPENPSEREGINLYRGSVKRLLSSERSSPGWFWDLTQDKPTWKPLHSNNDLSSTYVVCLKPDFAAYDHDSGLCLGKAGNEVSPVRTPPNRPGYKPLNAEAWLAHAQNVANHCLTRFDLELPPNSPFINGLLTRYNLSRDHLHTIITLTGLLHDFGKLNYEWQTWAEHTQRTIDSSKLALMPLAHTDSPINERTDSASKTSIIRPPHAPGSAFIIRFCYSYLIKNFPDYVSIELISACAAAVISHHGGWLPETICLETLTEKWKELLNIVLKDEIDETIFVKTLKYSDRKKKDAVDELLKCTTSTDNIQKFWPLVAYLTRTLRLSDQGATAEGGS